MAGGGGEVAQAQRRLEAAEKELGDAKAKLGTVEAAQPLNEQRVAEAKVGVAEAKVGVAEANWRAAADGEGKAKLWELVAESRVGVAEAKWEAESNEGKKAKLWELVAEAKVGVAEAKVGVAEAKWEAESNEGKKAKLWELVAGAKAGVDLAREGVKSARAALHVVSNAAAATPGGGVAAGAAGGEGVSLQLGQLNLGLQRIEQTLILQGSEIKQQGSEIKQQGSEIKQQGSEIKQQGSEIKQQGSRLEDALCGAKSSPTPATLGRKAVDSLKASQNWIKLDGTGGSILQAEVDSGQISNESSLVQILTPLLREVVESASAILGIPLVLVNTERHAYFEDPHGGSASKPDMLVTHPAFYTWNKSDGDVQYCKDGFIFGKGADWCLRDCWEVIVECKKEIGMDNFTALGEGIEYARRKSFVSTAERLSEVDSRSRRFTRLIVCDSKHFYLVLCVDGNAARCVWGAWVDPGSKDATVDFLVRGFETESLTRTWVNAIESSCTQFDVTLLQPNEDVPTCFLGAGGCGRVFRVLSNSQDKKMHGLKVGVGDVACSQIREEWSKFEQYSQSFSKAEAALVVISKYYESTDRACAAILLEPVGLVLPRTQKAIKSALEGLMMLSNSGFGHGDARICNVVWMPDTECCKWVDLRTICSCSADTKVATFTRDAVAFFSSCRLECPQDFSQIAAKCLSEQSVSTLLVLCQKVWNSTQ